MGGKMFPKQYLFENEAFQIESHDKHVEVRLASDPVVIRITPHPEGCEISHTDERGIIYPLPIDAIPRACEILLAMRANREEKRRAEQERSRRLHDLHRFVEDLPDNIEHP